MAMNKQLLAQSYNALQEWAKWMISIETAICAGLWPKLTEVPRPPAPLYLGWLMFVGSIITAVIMVGAIGFYHQRIEQSGDLDAKQLKVFVIVQYGFFFAGILFFLIRLIGFWLGV
jgi:hypothetical protein